MAELRFDDDDQHSVWLAPGPSNDKNFAPCTAPIAPWTGIPAERRGRTLRVGSIPIGICARSIACRRGAAPPGPRQAALLSRTLQQRGYWYCNVHRKYKRAIQRKVRDDGLYLIYFTDCKACEKGSTEPMVPLANDQLIMPDTNGEEEEDAEEDVKMEEELVKQSGNPATPLLAQSDVEDEEGDEESEEEQSNSSEDNHPIFTLDGTANSGETDDEQSNAQESSAEVNNAPSLPEPEIIPNDQPAATQPAPVQRVPDSQEPPQRCQSPTKPAYMRNICHRSPTEH